MRDHTLSLTINCRDRHTHNIALTKFQRYEVLRAHLLCCMLKCPILHAMLRQLIQNEWDLQHTQHAEKVHDATHMNCGKLQTQVQWDAIPYEKAQWRGMNGD